MNFKIAINQFLTIDIKDMPIEATVSHNDGFPHEITVPVCVLPHLNAGKDFFNYIEAAAKNNYASNQAPTLTRQLETV